MRDGWGIMSSMLISSAAGSITLDAPYYPYQVTWGTAASIAPMADGSYSIFDPGADFDNWTFDGNFRCSPADVATLDAIYASGEPVQCYPDGFALFSPLHRTSSASCAITSLEIGAISNAPYRHYTPRITLKLLSVPVQITPPTVKLEGSLIIGGLSGLRMPDTLQYDDRGVRWAHRHGRAHSALVQPRDYTDSQLTMETYEDNLCAIQGYLEAQRYADLSITSGALYYLFGAKRGNGAYVAKLISNEITFSCVGFNFWNLILPLHRVSNA